MTQAPEVRLTHANIDHLREGYAIVMSADDGSAYCLRRIYGEHRPPGCSHPQVTLTESMVEEVAEGYSIRTNPVTVHGLTLDEGVVVRLFASVSEFRHAMAEAAERHGITLGPSNVTDEQIAGWIEARTS